MSSEYSRQHTEHRNAELCALRVSVARNYFMKDKPNPRRKKKLPRQSTPAQREMLDYSKRLSEAWSRMDLATQNLWQGINTLLAHRKNFERGVRAVIPVSKGGLFPYNAFREINLLAHSVGQNVIITQPGPKTYMPDRLSTLRAELVDEKKIIVTWDSYGQPKPTFRARIWVYSRKRQFHTQIAGTVQVTDKRLEITSLKGKGGKPQAISGLKKDTILIQADVVDWDTGWPSGTTETIALSLK